MVKAIIFDADGMIVSGERFSDRLAANYGISAEITAEFFRGVFQDCLVGRADLKEELKKYLSQWGWGGDVEELVRIWFDKKYNQIDERFYPILEDLRSRGIKTYLATNNEAYRTNNLFVERGLKDYFDGVLSSSDAGFKKPELGFFQFIVGKVGCEKQEIIFWDDDVENVEAACAFGFRADLYKDFDTFLQETSHS